MRPCSSSAPGTAHTQAQSPARHCWLSADTASTQSRRAAAAHRLLSRKGQQPRLQRRRHADWLRPCCDAVRLGLCGKAVRHCPVSHHPPVSPTCAPCKAGCKLGAAARLPLPLRLPAAWKPCGSSCSAGCKLTCAAKLSARRCSAAACGAATRSGCCCCCCCSELLAPDSASAACAGRVLACAGCVSDRKTPAAGSADATLGSCCCCDKPTACSGCCTALLSCSPPRLLQLQVGAQIL